MKYYDKLDESGHNFDGGSKYCGGDRLHYLKHRVWCLLEYSELLRSVLARKRNREMLTKFRTTDNQDVTKTFDLRELFVNGT